MKLESFDVYAAFGEALNILENIYGRGFLSKLSEMTKIPLPKLSKIKSGKEKGREPERRLIAQACGYRYDEFLRIPKLSLGKPEIAIKLLQNKFNLDKPLNRKPDYVIVCRYEGLENAIVAQIGEAWNLPDGSIALYFSTIIETSDLFSTILMRPVTPTEEK